MQDSYPNETRITEWADAEEDQEEGQKIEESSEVLSPEVRKVIEAQAAQLAHLMDDGAGPQYIEQVQKFNACFYASMTGNHAAEI